MSSPPNSKTGSTYERCKRPSRSRFPARGIALPNETTRHKNSKKTLRIDQGGAESGPGNHRSE
uniref:Uncharacterized protein n=1 Tax=Arundo donax TaxID=35708 RepID=A0A0A9H7V4_ARUDO